MAAPILPIRPVVMPELAVTAASTGKSSNGFQGVFAEAVSQVEQLRSDAHAGIEKMLNGEDQELHQTVLDVQKAELGFDLFLQMRNKVISAYQEVMRMQV